MADFKEMALKEYQDLQVQEKKLKEEITKISKKREPLRKYLVSVGLIEVKRRGRPPKKNKSE